MQVIWCNVLLTGDRQSVFIHTNEGLLIDDLTLSPLLLTTLCVDRSNRVAEGNGSIIPTPWGWFWDAYSGQGKLPEIPKLSEIKDYTLTDETLQFGVPIPIYARR